jgi:putative ABC transport system substrate-binding protein
MRKLHHRRRLLLFLGAAAAWLPLAAAAQQQGPAVVGILALAVDGRVPRLKESLRRLGYTEGQSVRFIERPAEDRYGRLAEIAEELVRLKVNVIVAIGTTATVTASKATSSIPIVMVAGVDPVKEKLAASLSRPGGNVTGVSTIIQELVPKRLELAHEAVGGLARVGVLWNPDSRGSTNSLAQARDAAKRLKLALQVVEVRSAADFDKAFEALAAAGTRVFVWLPTGMFSANRESLLKAAARHRMAGIFSSEDWVESGGMMAYGPNDAEHYQHAAAYVDRILKGARPGELPIEQPTRLALAVNLKAARALGISIPRSVLMRADRVIE